MKQVIFGTLVYGPKYTESFLEIALPAMIDNMIEINANKTYVIYSTSEDASVICKHPLFIKLSKVMTVQFREAVIKNTPEDSVNNYFLELVKKAYVRNGFLKVIQPDTVPSADTLITAWRKIEAGYEAVLIPSGALRVNWEMFAYHAIRLYRSYGSLNIPSDDLIKMFCDYCHHETLSHCIDSKTFHPSPSMIINKKDYEFTVHSFYSQPYFVRTNNLTYRVPEDDYVVNGVDPEKIYIAKSPYEMMEVNLTQPYGQEILWPKAKYSPNVVINTNFGRAYHLAKKMFFQGYKTKNGPEIDLKDYEVFR